MGFRCPARQLSGVSRHGYVARMSRRLLLTKYTSTCSRILRGPSHQHSTDGVQPNAQRFSSRSMSGWSEDCPSNSARVTLTATACRVDLVDSSVLEAPGYFLTDKPTAMPMPTPANTATGSHHHDGNV